MKPYRQREMFIRFERYTGGMNLYPFLFITPIEIYFDCSKYLDWCEKNGLGEEESIEEFNIRKFHFGKRLNHMIKEML